MPTARPARAIVILLALASTGLLGPSAPAKEGSSEKRVELVRPFEIASIAGPSRTSSDKFAALAEINPDRPIDADMDGQTLSMFGREDLIAKASDDYQSSRCSPLTPAPDVFAEIERRARSTLIVIVNESHERSEHRGFIAELAARLRPLGYDTLAIETLSNNPPGTPEKYLPTFLKQPDLPYFEDGDGYYLSEAGFGRLGRKAKALGYRLLPYEPNGDQPSPDMTQDQRIAIREEGQARNLAAYLHDHPGAKLLIHVGYSHAAEVPRADGARWMATRLKEKTGIDPLTISQTTCRGGGKTVRLSALPADQPIGTFDLIVDHPGAHFEGGRPEWRKRAGDRVVRIPKELYPAAGWRVIEARPIGETIASVPMDRVAIRRGEDIALMLPPGRYHLRVTDVAGPKRKSAKPAS